MTMSKGFAFMDNMGIQLDLAGKEPAMTKVVTTAIPDTRGGGTLQIRPSAVPGELVLLMLGPRNGILGGLAMNIEMLKRGLAHAGIIEKDLT